RPPREPPRKRRPSLPNPQVRIETYQAHGLPAVGRFLFSIWLASSSSWGMIVARVSPARSWAGSCLRPGSRTVARPVRAVSGQRNASHGPCTLDVDDRGRQFAVGKWLLLLLAGTPVVRPALLWQWQWHGMLRDDAWRGLRRPDFDRCGSADLCRPAGNDSERPGAHHGAAIVSAAPAHAPAGANHALSADEENRQLMRMENRRSNIECGMRNTCFRIPHSH